MKADPQHVGRFFTALERPFAARDLDWTRQRLRMFAADRLPDPAACASVFAAFEPHVPWERPFLAARRRCYAAARHPLAAAAERDYADFLSASAPEFDVVAPASP